MKKQMIGFLITLAGMFILSAALLAIFSAVVWKMDAGAGVVGGCVTAVYIIANLAGGICAGKMAHSRKFLWGLLIGVCYFLILLIVGTFCIGNELPDRNVIIGSALTCTVAAMFGGMLTAGSATS